MRLYKNCSHTASPKTIIFSETAKIARNKRRLDFFNRKFLVKLLTANEQYQINFFFLLQVLVTDPEQLEKIRDREADITKERIMKILNSGANVILTTGGIDDLCLKYFVEAGAMAVRRCKKVDLKRIAKCTGAQFITSLANLEGEESFEASFLGKTFFLSMTVSLCDLHDIPCFNKPALSVETQAVTFGSFKIGRLFYVIIL